MAAVLLANEVGYFDETEASLGGDQARVIPKAVASKTLLSKAKGGVYNAQLNGIQVTDGSYLMMFKGRSEMYQESG
jgi:hypothetical protein